MVYTVMHWTLLSIVLLCAPILQLADTMAAFEFSAYLDVSGARLCAGDRPTEEVTAVSEINCGASCIPGVSCFFFTFHKTTRICRLYNFQPEIFDIVEGCLSFVSKV